MAGLKNYLKEKPRGPRFQDEEAISKIIFKTSHRWNFGRA
jgi:hypothetical protein